MKVKCNISRFDGVPAKGRGFDGFELDVDPTETVLGALVKINHRLDCTVSFRYACGVVKCGECAVEVNGHPFLACEKTVEADMRIEPLSNLPVIKDLVVDRRAELDRILAQSPELRRLMEGAGLRELTPEEGDKFVRLTKCFECLICQSVCPVRADMKEQFVGPLGVVWLAQMALDRRNRGVLGKEIDAALQMCMRCGICSDACACSEDIIGLALDTLEEG